MLLNGTFEESNIFIEKHMESDMHTHTHTHTHEIDFYGQGSSPNPSPFISNRNDKIEG
jgi:hypothetical protein